MPISAVYLSTATTEFCELQSGLGRPFWEVNISVSATAGGDWCGTLGQSYATGNDIVSFGSIDRERSITIKNVNRLTTNDITIRLSNASGRYSPLNPNSIFYDQDWFNSIVKIWSGFQNVSGTALVVQKGTFIVEELQIDSENAVATLKCTDRLGLAIGQYVGLPNASGTANARVWTGLVSSKTILADLLSGIGLTAGEMSLSEGVDFFDLSISAVTYGEALAKVAAASEGFIFVDNVGKIKFRTNIVNYGALRPTWNMNINNNIIKNKYTLSVENLVNELGVKYEADLLAYNASEVTATVPKGRTFVAENRYIQSRARAQSFTSRNLDVFKVPSTLLEIDSVWMPAVDLGDYFRITDKNLYFSGISSVTFEVYKIREDMDSFKHKLYLIEVPQIHSKWGYFSDTGISLTSVDFSGGWWEQFAFFGRDSGTALSPGFDDSSGCTPPLWTGANNNILNNSGNAETSMEEPFVFG